MFSGKTEELIRRLRRAKIAKQNVQVFKPAIDDRYHESQVTSHSGMGVDARPVQSSADIVGLLRPETTVVAIDEVQFFDDGIISVCETLAGEGKRVICAGLDTDFRGEPFGPIPELMARAEYVRKLHAICMICSEEASRTQRLLDGEPAAYDDPIVMVGANDVYEARCRQCHEVLPARSEQQVSK